MRAPATLTLLTCLCVVDPMALPAAPPAAPSPRSAQAPAGTAAARRPDIPRVWDDAALEDWATPLAGLNARPRHMTSAEYYAIPADNLRGLPFYAPGREPAGYWDRLQAMGPQPLIEPDRLSTDADWIAAGEQVFRDMDHLQFRTRDPELIALVRDPTRFAELSPTTLPDGTMPDLRWVPTSEGVALGFPSCSPCHTGYTPDLRPIPGVPVGGGRTPPGTGLIVRMHAKLRVVLSASPFTMAAGPLGDRLYQAYGVPWREDDENRRLKAISDADFNTLRANAARSNGFMRWNGSPYFPTKAPDLVGVEKRAYLDATATHLHRNIGDLMRYAALVMTAEPVEFGPHRVVAADTRRVAARRPDEALYALARYIYSLKPPPNPNPFDEQARAGQAIFEREDCGKCHTPPHYTSNKLTIAEGFRPPADLPASLAVLRKTVGTDSGLALRTRKGTGFYKVPSLLGVRYRGAYLHDGAAATLEEMFDPNRLKASHVRGGWTPVGEKTRAIPGHDFGLELAPDERRQLLAFLRTL